jgi:hypothetical protein
MAHFYASIQGNRGEATRCGSKSSGIEGHIRGWNIGARVTVDHIEQKDIVSVYLTRGSNGYGSTQIVSSFTEKDFPLLALNCEQDWERLLFMHDPNLYMKIRNIDKQSPEGKELIAHAVRSRLQNVKTPSDYSHILAA